MALPIAPTPFLTGRDAERFDRIVEWGLKHRLKPRAAAVDWDRLHEAEHRAVAEGKAVTRKA